MPTLFQHGHRQTFITGDNLTRLEEKCPRDLFYFAILGPSLSIGRKTRSKTDKLLANLQLNIAELGLTTIKGHGELPSKAEVKTLEFLYEREPPIFLKVTAGTVEQQQSLDTIRFIPHDWSHGASAW
jgi:hypothetical protein